MIINNFLFVCLFVENHDPAIYGPIQTLKYLVYIRALTLLSIQNQDKPRLMIINLINSRPRTCKKVIVLEIRDQESCMSKKSNKKQKKQDQAELSQAQLPLG